ncbi:MAG: transporter ATP-binding protein/permease [Patescibacteria group bacterium]|nr:transporter ATP-binding protein/permease [Patescibacteria group bacterium]
MKNFKEYLKSVRFSLGHAFKFVPKETSLIFFVVIISACIPYASSYLLGKLVNDIFIGAKTGVYEGIWYIIFLYAFISSLPTFLGNIQTYIRRRWNLKFQTDIELYFMKVREQIDIAHYEDPKFQDLLQRSFRNGINPLFGLTSGQFNALQSLTGLLFGTILAIHFNLFVYLCVILSAIPSFLVDIKYASWGWSIWQKDSPALRRLSDLRQHVTFRTLLIETKLLQSGNKILDWMRQILVDFANIQLKTEKSKLFSTSLTDVIAFVGFGAGLFLVMQEVISGRVPVGGLVYMLGTLSNVRASISSLLTNISEQFDVHLIVKDMMEVVDTKPTILESKKPITLDLETAPEIVFEKIGFKYHNSDKWSLRNINLTFRSGDNIGLVGNNGAGKTTLVKLLCRIYDPTEGRILINGIDLKDISIKEWWSYLAVMFQDYASYDFVTKDAIAIGRPNSSINLTKVVEAAHVSQSHVFIEEWKDKYEQQIGVEFAGVEPSKGQRQKLSIAKILYRDGRVMILDEPTASVDAESEAKIFDSIENLSKNTTALLISHDFSTISECDKIFVLDKGKLIEEGNHKELMNRKGMYAELYTLQAKRFKK